VIAAGGELSLWHSSVSGDAQSCAKGIYNGRGLAAALMWGATAVWVGTRFVNAEEAGAPVAHQKTVINTDFEGKCALSPKKFNGGLAQLTRSLGTVRTIIFTGRPLRVAKTPFIEDW
jgi:NAD(P)H-dependent flavin oxidoreductase YrpB (nitropropane dioxygenase family)